MTIDNSGYWAGVFTGMICSVIFLIVCCFILNNKMILYEAALQKLNQNQEELVKMYAEHEKIMKAYEFYNWKMGFTEEKKNF